MPAREHIAPLLLGEASEVDAVAAGWGINERISHDEMLVRVVAEHYRLILCQGELGIAVPEKLAAEGGETEIDI
jgi:hypothetical protein